MSQFFTINKYNFVTKFLVDFIFIYILIFDNINGYIQVALGTYTPLGVMIRGAVTAVLFHTLLIKKASQFTQIFILLLCLYLFSIPFWSISSPYLSLGSELYYLFKILYFFLFLNYFYYYKDQIDIKRLVKIVYYSGVIIGFLNICCVIFGIGNNSYGKDYGFGYKVFFTDGNSLAIYMSMISGISIWYALNSKKLIHFLGYLLVLIGTICVGSRIAILGSIIIFILFFLYILFTNDRYIKLSIINRLLLGILFLSLSSYGIYKVYEFVVSFDSFMLERFTSEGFGSARGNLKGAAMEVINNFSGSEVLVGGGYSQGLVSLGAEFYGSSSSVKSVESDFYDSILSFGWGLGIIISFLHIWLYIKLFVKPYLKSPSSLSFVIAMIGTLWLGACHYSGHGFFNSMLAPIFGLVFLLDYNKDKLKSNL